MTGAGRPAVCLCGSTVRRRIDTDDAMFRRPADADGPGWDPLKHWTIKYLQFAWNVNLLRRLYAAGSTADAAEARLIVEQTLASSVSLGEWLTMGPEPVTVTPGDVTRLIDAEPLSISAALANRGEGAPRSHVLPVAFTGPPEFWVEYRRPNAAPVRYDALDLAVRCLSAWQVFLTARGVSLPSW